MVLSVILCILLLTLIFREYEKGKKETDSAIRRYQTSDAFCKWIELHPHIPVRQHKNAIQLLDELIVAYDEFIRWYPDERDEEHRKYLLTLYNLR